MPSRLVKKQSVDTSYLAEMMEVAFKIGCLKRVSILAEAHVCLSKLVHYV